MADEPSAGDGTRHQVNGRRTTRATGIMLRLLGQLSRLLVPEDRQSDQEDSNDPEHDVFGAILFFGFSHKRGTAYLKMLFKSCFDFAGKIGLLRLTAGYCAPIPPIFLKLHNFPDVYVLNSEVQGVIDSRVCRKPPAVHQLP